MQLARSGRFVFIAQWVAAVLLPACFFLGRGFIGAEVGWMGIIGIVYGWTFILLLLVPPLLTLFDSEVRPARRTRVAYDIATFVLWGAIIVGSVSVPDSGDSGHLRTALTTWTGGVIGDEASTAVFVGAVVIMGIAYVAVLVLSILGIGRGRGTVKS